MVRVFGIRHHGPGCARSLRAALDEMSPDVLLIEGPPEAEEVLHVLASAELVPPVAMLLHPADDPARSTIYPLAEFSPEWQAMRQAVERGTPVRLIDMPAGVRAALDRETSEAGAEDAPVEEVAPRGAEPHEDPIGTLARAAGYVDRELWWERQVEQRRDALGLFDAILEAMTALRAEAPEPSRDEKLREAFMRRAIRVALKEGFARVAVVCGAWHAPVLASLPAAKEDDALLKSLPKTKVAATWIPWTHSRLLARSGYGAGIESPGWYQLLWQSPDEAPTRWATLAARLLRRNDLDASSASVVDAVRLADALAGVRGLTLPGLAELNESIQATLCGGAPERMALIRRDLEIGEAMGRVPADLPTVPLQRDLEARQKSLRLKPTVEIKKLDLDLRQDTDRERSALLHQLQVLGIPWGQRAESVKRSTGTFRETWKLQWQVEFPIRLIEMSMLGSTVEAAATSRVRQLAAAAADLPELTALLDATVLAGLTAAIDHVLACVQERSAASPDVRHLMEALPPLARIMRYGDVRGTPVEHVGSITRGLFARAIIGLPGACAALDDDAARAMVEAMASVGESVALLDEAEMKADWLAVLATLHDSDAAHGHVRGWACRLMLEAGALDEDALERRAGLELSPVTPPLHAAAWLTGVLRGSGLVLLSKDALWRCLDAWLRALPAETFMEMLPLVRRAFADFQPPERRQMGEKVKHLASEPATRRPAAGEAELDAARAARVLPILATVLGVAWPPERRDE